MKRWEDHCGSRRAETAAIFGRGPSLKDWIDDGSPKIGDFKIGINHTGLLTRCDYNVSRHYLEVFSSAPGEWFIPFIHDWEYMEGYSKCHFVRPIFEYQWFIPVAPSFFSPTRQDMKNLRTFFTDGGSANCAVELAYYLGASSIVFVGIDGGTEYADIGAITDSKPTGDYNLLKAQVIAASERRFPGNYIFWQKPLAKKEMGQ